MFLNHVLKVIPVKNYYQPHLGFESVFSGAQLGDKNLRIAIRAGGYYDTEFDSFGYSGGIDFKYYLDPLAFSRKLPNHNESSYIYVGYSFTKEKNIQPSENNHIISLGMSIFVD